jgi:hypothetical protein
VGRIIFTILGFAAIGVGGIFIAQRYAGPAAEKAEAGKKVLTHAYEPQFRGCRALDDEEVPESLPRPGVDEDLVYVEVVVLYPGVERVPEPRAHRLIGVNGADGALEPETIDVSETEEGAFLTLVFRADNAFQFARLVRDEEVLFERIDLD